MIRQSQQLKLLQRLSPQQIQLMKLLQLPTMSLEERIKEELEINPALEYEEGEEPRDDDAPDTSDEENISEDEASDGAEDDLQPADMEDMMRSDDEREEYEGTSSSSGENDVYQSRPGEFVSVETDFYDHVLNQLGMLRLDERSNKIAEQVIGSMDEDGYLRREVIAIVDDLAFGQNIYCEEDEINEIIQLVRQFDPPGICTWTLQECLLLQLSRMQPQTDAVTRATDILTHYYDDFIRKYYDKIQKALALNEAEFREAVHTIIRLNPKPGSAFAVVNKAETYVTPDFFIDTSSGDPEVTLNGRNAPELRVSPSYQEMMQTYDKGSKTNKAQKEAVTFIRQKLDSAKWFIDAIKQRQQTLLHTMTAIVTFQREFFMTGDETTLRPMILKDIAGVTGLDVSTVSRVANSKYVQTEFGTYSLKYFFSEGLQTESGEEVSTREVKHILNELVQSEDKRNPLSDDKLTDLLAEKGYNIARRTTAKYREQLNIPIARLRREA